MVSPTASGSGTSSSGQIVGLNQEGFIDYSILNPIVDIEGGSIDGTIIGSSVAAAGTFTTLVATQSTYSPSSSGAISYGLLTYSDVNIIVSLQSAVDTYNQVVLLNSLSASASGSSNWNVSNDITTAGKWFGEFGMNSSGFVGLGTFNTPNMVYIAAGAGSDFAIGTYGSNTLHFVTNSSDTDAANISPSGTFTIQSIVVNFGTIDNTVVGATTPAASNFTTSTVQFGPSLAQTDITKVALALAFIG